MNNTHIERTKEFERLYELERNTLRKIDERIDQREKQIERLKKKRTRAYQITPNWTEFILKPLIEELKGLLPNVEFKDDERYTPMGLCSRVSIFPKYKGKTIMLCIVPMDITKGEIAYETDKQIESFPKGTIGEINGIGKETIIITSAKQVAFYLIKKYNIEMKLQWCSFYEFHEKLQNEDE